MIVRSLSSIRAELSDGYRYLSSNKLTDAQAVFRAVLLALTLVAVTSDDEAKTVRPCLLINGDSKC